MAALVILLTCTALIVLAANQRAFKEANRIRNSSEPLGFTWHVHMWLTGKAGTGLICATFFGLTVPNFLPGFLAMGAYSMLLYWLCFDVFLNIERSLPTWYISQGTETALSDKLLRNVQRVTGFTEKQTHLLVKVPLILYALLACILAAFK